MHDIRAQALNELEMDKWTAAVMKAEPQTNRYSRVGSTECMLTIPSDGTFEELICDDAGFFCVKSHSCIQSVFLGAGTVDF